MRWEDDGIVLACRAFGESSAIVELFTPRHGRHAGLVKGGLGKRLRPVLQLGNMVRGVWRARLEEQLGILTVEPVAAHGTACFDDAAALDAIAAMAALLQRFPERDPHPSLYAESVALLAAFTQPGWMPTYLRWELTLLDEAGFGLDLSCCAATGATEDLRYVSPRTGRAVGGEAGAPYADRLLALPAFMTEEGGQPDYATALELTGFFIARELMSGAALPVARQRLQQHMM